MKFVLDFQSEIDILTKDELDDSLAAARDGYVRALLRGIKWMRLPILRGTAQGGALVLGAQDATVGPESGFAWSLRRIAVAGLSSGDVVGIYRNSSNNPPMWQVDDSFPFAKFGLGEMVLTGGDEMVVASIGAFGATGTIQVTGELLEVPMEMLPKLAL